MTTKQSNVIPFKKFSNKKKKKTVSSTIAAIIAVKIEHPNTVQPEDYLIENIEHNENFELLAFEDALDTFSENLSNNKNMSNFINDA